MALSLTQIENLENKARDLRISVIEMLSNAGSGHTAGTLGMADIFSYLYFYALKHNPENPNWEDRDRLILSNGHICPILYASMAHSGYFSLNELKNLRKFGSKLQGHPHRDFLQSVETSSGPLGSGLSQASGMALAFKMDNIFDRKVFCLMSDGELDEGNSWEAIMFASKYKLDNLIAIIDRNNIQIDGFTDDVMPLGILADKFDSFGWNVYEIDGHNFEDIDRAMTLAKESSGKPSVIIAKTIPGKGVSFMENKWQWHGKSPSKDEARVALEELNK